MRSFILIFSIIFLYGCGYTPLYKSSAVNFYFSEVKSKNENTYFKIFETFISQYKIDRGQKNNYSLEIKIEKNKKILSKDSSGNPLVYLIILAADAEVTNYERKIISKKYKKKFKYSHDSNIFDLNLYEKDIEKKLLKQIADELIISIITLDNTSLILNTNKIKVKVSSNPKVGYAKDS